MASITSVISLFVLLLVTYCYSVPVEQSYEFTTEKMLVERENDMNMKLMNDDETTVVPTKKRTSDIEDRKTTRELEERDDDLYKKRKVEERDEDDSYKKRTVEERDEDDSYKKRTVDERDEDDSDKKRKDDEDDSDKKRKDDEDDSDKKRGVEDYLYTTMVLDTVSGEKQLRGFDDYLYTTVETKTLFNDRAIRGRKEGEDRTRGVLVDDKPEIVESSHVEPESSVKTTGLRDIETKERTRDVRPIGERITDPEIVVPGKITEKVYDHMPVKTEARLDEDRTRTIAEKKMPDN